MDKPRANNSKRNSALFLLESKDRYLLRALREAYPRQVKLEARTSNYGRSLYWVRVLGHGSEEITSFLRNVDKQVTMCGRGRPRKYGVKHPIDLLRLTLFLAVYEQERRNGAKYVDAIRIGVKAVKDRWPESRSFKQIAMSESEAKRILRDRKTWRCTLGSDGSVSVGYGRPPTFKRIKPKISKLDFKKSARKGC